MGRSLTITTLRRDNESFAGTGGVSSGQRRHDFLPAFRDNATGRIYLSRYADGGIAPIHVLEGLPNELVTGRSDSGAVLAVKATVVPGFVRANHFYTRGEAAAECEVILIGNEPAGCPC